MANVVVEKAGALIAEALAEAYGDGARPAGVETFLERADKPGKVCSVFFSGRSGSYFAQSFFDSYTHPQVLTAHPVSLTAYDSLVTPDFINAFPSGADKHGQSVELWCDDLLAKFSMIYTPLPSQPEWDTLCAPKETFSKFVLAQLLLLERPSLTCEALLKILMIAYRLSRGGPLECNKPLAYIWQAHVPSKKTKRWIRTNFADALLLTVVRFPEKALDSHLIHHAFETISPPRSTLLRRLLFEHMAPNSSVAGAESDSPEYAIRFEDLHHHTATVLRALCSLLDVPFYEAMCATSFSMQALGRKVSGARRLLPEEFACKLLNYYDRLKVRFLLQEEYAAWGYGGFCENGLDGSLNAYRQDAVARDSPFCVQALLADLDRTGDGWFSSDPNELNREMLKALRLQTESRTLRDLLTAERERRAGGTRITPLLYSLEGLSWP